MEGENGKGLVGLMTFFFSIWFSASVIFALIWLDQFVILHDVVGYLSLEIMHSTNLCEKYCLE